MLLRIASAFVLVLLPVPVLGACHKSHEFENHASPITDDDLQQRAKSLFSAIVADDPSLAEPFWFPREPFTPLKDVPDPDGYWSFLHRAYANDIHKEHAAVPSWEGATFERFDVGAMPKWIPPGDEHNNIGYYRSLRCSLHYRLGDAEATIPVETIITWQGRWFVTHLHKVKR